MGTSVPNDLNYADRQQAFWSWLISLLKKTQYRGWSPRGPGTMNQGIYEGCTNSWHTLVTPEALSQINDTVTRGLITKWGYRLEKANFLVDGGFLRTAPSRVIMGGVWTQRSRLRVSEHLMLSNFSPALLSGIMGLQYRDVVWQTACCRAARESELQCWTVSFFPRVIQVLALTFWLTQDLV